VTGKRTVGFVGDSTFFHAGMPALLNAIKEDANIVVVILDNRVTAMTGFQESAGHEPGHEASIEGVARSMGARHVATVDPFDTAAAVAAFWKAGAETGVSVLILDRGCPVHEAREGRSTGGVTYGVDHSLCRKCGREEHELRCSQETTRGYERRLSVGRIMRTGSPGPVVAPCSLMCPLSLCIEGYVGHIAAGEYEEAMGHILARTPLPETVCRTCHAPCEDACVRANSGGSIAINALKRFVVEWAAGREELARPPAHEERNGMEVAVVGAGPSGLSAAHELAVRGYGVTMFDAEDEPGGLLSHGIPRYRLPRGALRRDINRVLGLGVRFEGGTRLGRELSLDDLLGGGYDAVYLAIGAGRALEIDMPGLKEEGSPVVVTALEYLGKVARGMEVEGGKSVVVVGGGNAAIDAARTALRLGVERVSVACIEDLEDMPAIRNEVLSAGREGVELYPGLRPLRVRTGGITFGPAGGNGVETDLDADLVIVAIGQVPDTVGIDGEIALERNRDGSIRVDPVTCRTSHPRIFAGGDLVGGEQTVTGAIDATLRDEAIAGLRPPPRLQVPVEREALPLGARGWAVSGRLDPNELSPSSRVAGFDEVVGAFSQEEAVAEASRCLMCGLCGNCRACIELLGCPAIGEDAGGRVVVDPVLCTGCGVCAELCPNGAFHVVDHV
jgi:NADPH-dependent glutamate synthase beta subunit-like oxidoreductase